MRIDAATKRWIRNASDERAAANGCKFDEKRGQFVIDWGAKYLRLYEGDYAGEPLIARDWQVEGTMRLFGWIRRSERWKRWVRRFTQASFWVAKKNKKSPTLAWWGLYLLCADGEKGQKVYFGAKDGAQAREIAGKHAIEMVMASDELMAECTINKSLMQVTHDGTRSLLKPISSNDSRHQKAKEGLNGSLLIDETHVVDRDFMNRVSRAGISRSEPLLIEVSTAGNDPESYGRERYEYGKKVEAGEAENERMLFISYEAPQDLADDALAANPVKYGKLANPAWGHTVHEEEYLADYNSSKVSLVQLADFKMYRLNIWQRSANPWLPMASWHACGRDYTAASLEGRHCYAGLDLARTEDTTCLMLIFPEEEEGVYRLLPFYWLPEARATKLAKTVRYLEWGAQGHLTLTPGEVCDYRYVRRDINGLMKRFDILAMCYDDTYAEQLIQQLVEEDGMDHNCPQKFQQSMKEFASPTAAFERAVIERKMQHPKNPLLTWQAGNATAKHDLNGNLRPVKPKQGDIKTIDGIVAGIMGTAGLIAKLNERSVYETEGSLSL